MITEFYVFLISLIEFEIIHWKGNAAQPMMSIVRLFIRMMGEMNKETVTNVFFILF